MIYYANFSREYRIEIEASSEEEAQEKACNLSDEEIEAGAEGGEMVYWSVDED
jgi:hypothetical protein